MRKSLRIQFPKILIKEVFKWKIRLLSVKIVEQILLLQLENKNSTKKKVLIMNQRDVKNVEIKRKTNIEVISLTIIDNGNNLKIGNFLSFFMGKSTLQQYLYLFAKKNILLYTKSS
jgi:hypothetical protein